MARPRIRDIVLVTAAAVLTSAGLSALAAPAPDPTADPDALTATVEDPTESVTEDPTESAPPADDAKVRTQQRSSESDDVESKPEKQAKPAKPDAAKKAKRQGGPPSDARGEGRGNAHGKAVSAAARGETPPVGNCSNHGHWVSTVAKGLDSCDDNPRPAED